MSGIVQAKAIHSSGRGHGRSALTAADDNDNAMYSIKAVQKNKASATTTSQETTRL
jgi:hypothetical protein